MTNPESLDCESIVAAWAEKCSGPGWSNVIVNVLILKGCNYTLKALQARDCPDLYPLVNVSAVITDEMKRSVIAMIYSKKQKSLKRKRS